MAIYEDESHTQEDLLTLRKWNRCKVCGGMLNVFYDADKAVAYLACNTDQSHEGIMREARNYERGEETLSIPARRRKMEQQFGPKVTALEKYHGVTALTKEQAKEILKTVFPDAPETEMARAVLLCASYHLNPLMGHIFLIPFKNKETGKVSYATVIGIKAKRLLASRRNPFSYVDDTPRLMTEEEQKKIYGKVDTDSIVAITVLRDPSTGAEARGYGKWGKNATIYGTDKGNSAENMAFIRSESQALDRLCPGEMPMDIEVIDESYIPPAEEEKTGVLEGKIISKTPSAKSSPKHTSSELKDLKDMMKLCNWSAQDFGQLCVSKGWKIKVYEDLTPDQIAESIDHISKNPK